MERFSSKMSEIHWDGVLHTSNVQNAYTMFYNEFCDVYNTCFPVKVFKQGYRTRKPWLSEGMKKSIKVKTAYIDSTEKLGMLSMNQSINSIEIISINC